MQVRKGDREELRDWLFKIWWSWGDSNPLPSDCQTYESRRKRSRRLSLYPILNLSVADPEGLRLALSHPFANIWFANPFAMARRPTRVVDGAHAPSILSERVRATHP